jgi:hypothetical protein
MLSFHTTIIIKQASRWHLLKPCMDGNVEPHCLELDGRKPSIWTESTKRCQEASLRGEIPLKGVGL